MAHVTTLDDICIQGNYQQVKKMAFMVHIWAKNQGKCSWKKKPMCSSMGVFLEHNTLG